MSEEPQFFDTRTILLMCGELGAVFFFVSVSIYIFKHGSKLSIASLQHEKELRVKMFNKEAIQESVKFDRKLALLLPVIAAIFLTVQFVTFLYLSTTFFNTVVTACIFCVCFYTLEWFLREEILPRCWCRAPKCCGAVVALAINLWYVILKPWLLNNLLALPICLFVIQKCHLNKFSTAVLFLTAFFVCDVFMVFFSAVTVDSMAAWIVPELNQTKASPNAMDVLTESIEIPNKFMFPMNLFVDGLNAVDFGILGVGDVILPGIFIAFVKRFDCSLNREQNVYFVVSMVAYVVGLLSTFICATVYDHSQPGLLYLVPACILAPLALAFCKRDLRALLSYRDYQLRAPEIITDIF